MKRNTVISFFLLLVVTAAALAGCGGEKASTKTVVKTSPASTPSSTQPAGEPVPPPQYTPQGNTLTGTGEGETETFALGGLPVEFNINYVGSKPGFEVTLVNSLTRAETPVAKTETESTFNDSQIVSAAAGSYVLRVRASGPWTITWKTP